HFHLGALVLNKVLPPYLLDRDATVVAQRLSAEPASLAGAVAGAGEPAQVERVLKEVGESFLNFQVVATREAEQRAELAAAPEVVASVPYFEEDIYDLHGLLRMGERLWR
ncbi:MAG TPA: hypothetical protein VF640_05395, partial [Acidimicrobiales bacterium]